MQGLLILNFNRKSTLTLLAHPQAVCTRDTRHFQEVVDVRLA